MTPKAIETRLRSVAAFSEAGSDMCGEDEKAHAKMLFEGAHHIFTNAKLLSHAGDLRQALVDLLRDYNEQYQVLTDGEHGRAPSTPAWKHAKRLLSKLK